jgi:Mg-chelatase subunit ChlD
MTTTLKHIALSAALVVALTYPAIPSTRAAEARPAKQPVVQIAILLDTSGSMEGLIEQAKGQLWKIVNEFIAAKQNGQRPEVQVALYEYGKSSLAQSSGWIRRIWVCT